MEELAFLKAQKGLWLAALANSYFWLVGLLFQTNILIYGDHWLGDDPASTVKLALMPAFIGIGIAMGSLLAAVGQAKKWNWDWCRSAALALRLRELPCISRKARTRQRQSPCFWPAGWAGCISCRCMPTCKPIPASTKKGG
ncbi:MAG: hypothetical protein R3C26_16445 [Calditrichia bacterium]